MPPPIRGEFFEASTCRRASRAVRTKGEIRRFVWLAVVITLTVLGGRLANMYAGAGLHVLPVGHSLSRACPRHRPQDPAQDGYRPDH